MKNKSLKKITVIIFIIISIMSLFLEEVAANHWAEFYLDNLSDNSVVEKIFKGKDLNSVITLEDFQNLVKLVIDKQYNDRPDSITREAVVHELTEIWADKTGRDLDRIPVIKMLIYSDTEEINVKYINSITVAYMKNIAKGREVGSFVPTAEVTYGELAVMVYNTEIAIDKELAKKDEYSKREEKFETKGNYKIKDGKVVFDFELINHYTEEKQLHFSSGQQFEVVVISDDGKEVYRYSDGKFFTMALVYKDIKPGESLKWQDEWVLTNKEGEKLSAGEYTAVINILANPELTTTIDFTLENLNAQLECELTEEGIINPEVAKGIIKKSAEQVIEAIGKKDAEKVAEYVHPIKGVRFTPYTHVSLEQDLVFSKEEMRNFFRDQSSYLWGYYDGKGNEIFLTPADYYEEFIYSEDFVNAEEIGYNEVLSSGNMLENQFEVYSNSIVVEYYFPGFNSDYAGMDWRSLRLVFEKYQNSWTLTGVIHNQWTI